MEVALYETYLLLYLPAPKPQSKPPPAVLTHLAVPSHCAPPCMW
jgi:hypothetical protein